MPIRFQFQNKNAGAQFSFAWKRQARIAQKAAGSTATEASSQIQTLGRADIAAAGNFGSRWVQGFKATVLARGFTFIVNVTTSVPYFSIFEFGGIIRGKPLLWIPLSFAQDAQGVSAKNFPGGLFRVDRKAGGAPLLLSIATGEPKYFGKEKVTEPKKFHIRAIISGVAQSLPKIYKAMLARAQGSS